VLATQVQIRRCPKPVVAMVAGYAVGGGHILHMVCDLTVSAGVAKHVQSWGKDKRGPCYDHVVPGDNPWITPHVVLMPADSSGQRSVWADRPQGGEL
jgi:hypothetical protein